MICALSRTAVDPSANTRSCTLNSSSSLKMPMRDLVGVREVAHTFARIPCPIDRSHVEEVNVRAPVLVVGKLHRARRACKAADGGAGSSARYAFHTHMTHHKSPFLPLKDTLRSPSRSCSPEGTPVTYAVQTGNGTSMSALRAPACTRTPDA
jgi:hypothetical protein